MRTGRKTRLLSGKGLIGAFRDVLRQREFAVMGLRDTLCFNGVGLLTLVVLMWSPARLDSHEAFPAVPELPTSQVRAVEQVAPVRVVREKARNTRLAELAFAAKSPVAAVDQPRVEIIKGS